MTAFLSVTDLTVSYGATDVLRGVNLEIADAAFAAIVGPSGCGKTTLLRTIAGLERATSGDLRLGKQMMTTHGIHLAPHRRNIGWVPQDASLFPHLNVEENIAFGLASNLRAVKKASRGDRVQQLLDLVSLTALARRMPHELSGGQAQRVALARALANSPQLVLLDEPFAGLDPMLRADLRVEVKDILARESTTALLVTHDQTEALSLATHVVIMRDGIIEHAGSPREVYLRPATLWCAAFLGDTNVVPAQARSSSLSSTAFGDTTMTWMESAAPPTNQQQIQLMIRPESLDLVPGNSWQVADTLFAGHDVLVTLTKIGSSLENGRLKVLVPSRSIPALGSLCDVSITGAALGYPVLS